MLRRLDETIAELEKIVHEKEATLRRKPFREHVPPLFDSLWESFENASERLKKEPNVSNKLSREAKTARTMQNKKTNGFKPKSKLRKKK
ncbi:unnamed protein product [Nippostrongylus brasiliensis]|uniref:Transposase n=1 Tax=Nippostrongylus brasiliensis TaxID=27835 RepID=A0A0N4XFM1_NIPBR|nr:unnamed protein product [Nippostrongylus brasiliensis]